MKKYPGDIIILHKCTKTHDNMMCCSWDMVRGRCNYFSFWATFCPFTPLTAQKIKISLKWKKVLEISSFYASVPKIMIICYIVLEIWHMMYVIVVFHLGNFLHFYPLTAQKKKFQKNEEKKHLEISWSFAILFLRHAVWWMLYAILFLRHGTWHM